MRKRVLLTGGSGFIGRNVRESFLAEKYEIHAPTSRELNLIDTKSVDRYFAENKFDFVVHAAVKPGHRNAKDPTNLYYSNMRMFLNLERHCHEYDKMLIIGSGAIYDMVDYRPKMKEDEWTERIPADDHGFTKYTCEKIIANSRNIYDLRVFGIFGPYEDYAIRFISNAICKALNDMPITLRQDRRFDYIDVADLMPVIDWFLTHNPKYHSYNITPDNSVSLLDIAEMVREATHADVPIKVAAEGLGMEYSGDNSRLRAEWREYTLTPLRESIDRLVYYYRSVMPTLDTSLLLTDK